MSAFVMSSCDPAEQVVLWCLRRQAEGGADAARAIRRNLAYGSSAAHVQRYYGALEWLYRTLTTYGRRRLRFAEVGAEALTPDETAVLGLLRAERAGDEAEAACRVCWLVRREACRRCREAADRLAEVVAAAAEQEAKAVPDLAS